MGCQNDHIDQGYPTSRRLHMVRTYKNSKMHSNPTLRYAKEVHFGTTDEERSRRALGDDANIIHVEIGTSLHT